MSPDCSRIAVGDDKGVVTLCNANNGSRLMTFPPFEVCYVPKGVRRWCRSADSVAGIAVCGEGSSNTQRCLFIKCNYDHWRNRKQRIANVGLKSTEMHGGKKMSLQFLSRILLRHHNITFINMALCSQMVVIQNPQPQYLLARITSDRKFLVVADALNGVCYVLRINSGIQIERCFSFKFLLN